MPDTSKDPAVRDLRARCEKRGIVHDIGKRWEDGVEHHPEAERIFKMLETSDWSFGDDYFGWKAGGDGDNGETLKFSLSVLLELFDAEGNESQAVVAARRAGKAEGLREAAKLVDFSEERTGLESCCQRATRKYRNGAAAVLLTRAEEVER